MKNKKVQTMIFIIPLFLFTCLVLASCGSGSGTTSAGTGGVAFFLTDSLTDDLSEINITIRKIELLADDFRVTVFSGMKELNLLDLNNETELIALENNIPAIQYEKIRLYVVKNDIELIDRDGTPIMNKEIKLPGNGKIDLNPRSPFSVTAGEMLTIQLDMDAEKSLKLDENKNKYIFRPVIFIDIIDGTVPQDKLVRVKGVIRDIDEVNRKITLCLEESDNDCCVTIYVNDETSFFSSEPEGSPIEFEELAVGDTVTVIGFYSGSSSWIHEKSEDKDENSSCSMGLDALVIERGEFLKLRGTIASPVDTENPVIVQLQSGTKLYAWNGSLLREIKENELDQIEEGQTAEVNGILLLDPEPDILNAAFVLIDTSIVTKQRLSGEIADKDNSAKTFNLITMSGIVCVQAVYADIFLIQKTDHTYESIRISFMDLSNGQQVDLYGTHVSNECFEADTIIVFEVMND
jgi:hypothetical protein